ncbi:hypothetical protein OVY01_21390 [Robbsia sp. Bb-Pol-6]|uniref:DoxX family protein n=1 Tax=Robbsia betulipollinis TaxID=2981849 RepID=A0ABT3ZTY9_9BURK|nr:hypothetical protein [Robbsia betulipollinis]MCY0389702.1 hypothetical protein [Robbsia betulipollinis]
MRGESLARRAGRAFVFLWFFLGGIGHFAMTHAFATIVPPSIPHPVAMVYVSGVCELLGAFGILLAPTRQLAGWGLILLTLAVTPANVYMWQHAALFPMVPPWLLLLRLPVQVALLVCIWWSTRPRAAHRR